jgi:hypothetical protein
VLGLCVIVPLMVPLLLAGCGSERGARKRPRPVADAPAPVKPVVNVYIENSGSMDGYVAGSTDFEHAVYSYLSDIQIADVASGIRLFYVNSEVIPYDGGIEDFIDKLEPETFKKRGGVRKTSDIAQVLKTVLNATDTGAVSILISDYVFSPGKGKDAKEYLVNQQINIKNIVAERLKRQPNLAIAILRMTSQFDGLYYNCYDAPTKIKNTRPFYIWLMGDRKYIYDLRQSIPDAKLKGSGVTDSCVLMPGQGVENYMILQNHKFGSFERDRSGGKKSRTAIRDMKKETRGKNAGKFMFTIGADLSFFKTLPGDHYLLDAGNYAIMMNNASAGDLWNVDVYENNTQGSNYTHNIALAAVNKIPVGALRIALAQKAPRWIDAVNDDIGIDINANGAMGKTFGIKYLVEGVYEAYEALGNNYYMEMDFTLAK